MISSFIINYVFSTYLKLRQIRKIRSDTTSKYLSEEEFKKVKAYNLDKLHFSVVTSLFKVVMECLTVSYKLLPLGLSLFKFPYPILNQTLFYVLYLFLLSFIDIPFDLFYNFYIEVKHGFSTMTLKTFALDFVKNSLISLGVILVLMPSLLWIMSRFTSFYFYAFVFMVTFQLLMILIYPDYIQPLFNKFAELEEGSLKEEIRKLATQLNFKVSKIFKVDESTRSHHSNAYFTGLFKEKRIVLFDTLLEKTEDRQILSILCHEFGHAKLFHIPKKLALSIVTMFIYTYIFNLTVNLIKCEDVIKMVYFMFLSTIVEIPLKLITNMLNRKWEIQADYFAVKLKYGKDLGTALVKLHKDNKSIVNSDNLYSMFNYSHPTLGERLECIENEMKRNE
ncbi:MAG: M48 family metallopeptidase [Rickettsia endosymbiont of Ixodes persulcatus]|nr:M48 family metallopeptidase [Rickettsia endosymbiont of Ixodes persulcatus]